MTVPSKSVYRGSSGWPSASDARRRARPAWRRWRRRCRRRLDAAARRAGASRAGDGDRRHWHSDRGARPRWHRRSRCPARAPAARSREGDVVGKRGRGPRERRARRGAARRPAGAPATTARRGGAVAAASRRDRVLRQLQLRLFGRQALGLLLNAALIVLDPLLIRIDGQAAGDGAAVGAAWRADPTPPGSPTITTAVPTSTHCCRCRGTTPGGMRRRSVTRPGGRRRPGGVEDGSAMAPPYFPSTRRKAIRCLPIIR